MKVIAQVTKADFSEWDDVVNAVRELGGSAEVGYIGNKPHIGKNNGDGEKPTIGMADLATIHEYGAPGANIPERSFLRASLADNQQRYLQFLQLNIKPVLTGQTTMYQVWDKLGMIAQTDVQKYMIQGDFVPLKERTIKRKKSSAPLIDSGQMRQAVTYRVNMQEKI